MTLAGALRTDTEQLAGNAIKTGSGVGSAGSQNVYLATDQPSLTNAQPVAQSGAWTVQPGNTPNTAPWLVTDAPTSGQGTLVSSFLSTGAVQSTSAKASAGTVYSIQFFNVGAAPVYLRLYNQTTAPLSTDNANIVWRGVVPGNTGGAGFVIPFLTGLKFTTGIGYRCTAGVADTDSSALTANTVLGNVNYF